MRAVVGQQKIVRRMAIMEQQREQRVLMENLANAEILMALVIT